MNPQTQTQTQMMQAVYIIDPLSVAGQRACAVIELLSSLGIRQTIILIPKMEISNEAKEFPLQNFYSFVGSSASSGVGVGVSGSTGSAVFKSLPKQHTLTVRTDAPENWNIQAVDAIQDIDNLRCIGGVGGCEDSKDKEKGASAGGTHTEKGEKGQTRVGYALKSLLVPGQCFENENDLST